MEIKLGGQTYSIGKLDVIQQFHVARRLSPVMASLGTTAQGIRTRKDLTMEQMFAVMAGPLSEVVSKMSNEDSEFIIFTCLSVVQRKEAGGWANVVPIGGRLLAYQDIDLSTMMGLVYRVINENLGNFFPSEEQSS